MRLLTATRQAQGELPGDFFFTVEGELVLINDLVCARDPRRPGWRLRMRPRLRRPGIAEGDDHGAGP
jgi:hypothetical protein